MASQKIDILLHPTRIRILLTLLGNELTTQQIARAIPEVSQATLYRHIQQLYRAGILTVAREIRARGATEKVYAVVEQNTRLTDEELDSMSREDHLRGFTAFTTYLLGQFRNYLRQHAIHPSQDGIGYRIMPLYQTEAEMAEMAEALNAVIQPYVGQRPDSHRKRRLFSVITIPDPEETPDAQDELVHDSGDYSGS